MVRGLSSDSLARAEALSLCLIPFKEEEEVLVEGASRGDVEVDEEARCEVERRRRRGRELKEEEEEGNGFTRGRR